MYSRFAQSSIVSLTPPIPMYERYGNNNVFANTSHNVYRSTDFDHMSEIAKLSKIPSAIAENKVLSNNQQLFGNNVNENTLSIPRITFCEMGSVSVLDDVTSERLSTARESCTSSAYNNLQAKFINSALEDI